MLGSELMLGCNLLWTQLMRNFLNGVLMLAPLHFSSAVWRHVAWERLQ